MAYDLNRFLQAQQSSYDAALSEVRRGYKTSHWMWYIFPILRGLGRSSTAQFYGLLNTSEAREYYEHPVLGKRLVEISEALLQLNGLTANDVFGSTDAWKLHCCMTLFCAVAPECKTFRLVLEKYYDGRAEHGTARCL